MGCGALPRTACFSGLGTSDLLTPTEVLERFATLGRHLTDTDISLP